MIENCHVATCDVTGTEYTSGHVVIESGRITAVGAGKASDTDAGADAERIDAGGCLLTPGLINAHHHLFQWVTRAVSQDEILFGWLTR